MLTKLIVMCQKNAIFQPDLHPEHKNIYNIYVVIII